MFIILPLALIAGSAAGIMLIVHRKLAYLRKLTPESHQLGETVFHDFFPELIDWLASFDLREYKQQSLRELEKFLRKLRVVSMKIDHITDRLIKRIRQVHLSSSIEHSLAREKPAEDSPVSPTEQLKAQEQALIVEIAKNPKAARLYEVLGDLYMKMDNTADAREAYETALGLDPSNESLARKYSKLLQEITVA